MASLALQNVEPIAPSPRCPLCAVAMWLVKIERHESGDQDSHASTMSVWLAMRWRSFHRWTIDKAASVRGRFSWRPRYFGSHRRRDVAYWHSA
jgi:hypothetical protein